MELVVFIISAAVAILGAGAMALSKNAIHSALFLLLNLGAIAVLYLLLRAPFLFAIQLIVYAGAIIVLFLFAVMLLGAERAEDERDRIAWQRPVALAMGALLLIETIYVVFFAPRASVLATANGGGGEDFGAPVHIGEALFSVYLLPFELTSVILLAAIVGVVVLHRREQQSRGAE